MLYILNVENITFYSFLKCTLHTDWNETIPNNFNAAFHMAVNRTISHSSMFVEMKVHTHISSSV